MFINSTVLHGTPSGYKLHKARRETICEDCRDAHNSYMREYNKHHKSTRNDGRRVCAKARNNALKRLVDMNPSIYRLLYNEEKEKLELENGDRSLH